MHSSAVVGGDACDSAKPTATTITATVVAAAAAAVGGAGEASWPTLSTASYPTLPYRTLSSRNLTALLLRRGRLAAKGHAGGFRGRASLAVGHEAVLDGAGNADERLLDVYVVLGGTLPERDVEFLGQLLSLLRRHDLLVEHVALVPHQNLVDVHVRVLLDLGDPVADGLEGAAVGDVVDQQDALGAAEVGRGDGAEALLAGRVPDLQLDLGAVDVDVLDLEVDADGCDEGGAEGVVGVTQQQAGLTDAGVSDHQQLHLHVVRGAS
eukprot:CAMPEP_0119545592 /NCGR_PEP_ID=MMETSP1352-20130426/296_1 /TAXON_ID=265584 /ORGANISM="Stauroneis constricta, Strain CCMP1120" /LENGTH=265 /DNA_ID=CAMNT_0007590159 /DNA_START=330 /DNA_END=1129 /DNA_ORIENTATION=+